jgi:methanogenic corrinoid protein MtbC1
VTPSDCSWFVDLLLDRPPHEARSAVLAFAERGMRPLELYMTLLAPSLREIGARWERGNASVAQEHLATELVISIMSTLVARLDGRPIVAHLAVLAGTDGELHAIGLRMVNDFLEADGWEVQYLGALTPGPDLERYVRAVEPDVVGLSTTLTTHLPATRAIVAALKRLPTPPFVLVGGQAYGGNSAVALSLGADAFAADAQEASRILRAKFSGR